MMTVKVRRRDAGSLLGNRPIIRMGNDISNSGCRYAAARDHGPEPGSEILRRRVKVNYHAREETALLADAVEICNMRGRHVKR
jgi:hypothetical protein